MFFLSHTSRLSFPAPDKRKRENRGKAFCASCASLDRPPLLSPVDSTHVETRRKRGSPGVFDGSCSSRLLSFSSASVSLGLANNCLSRGSASASSSSSYLFAALPASLLINHVYEEGSPKCLVLLLRLSLFFFNFFPVSCGRFSLSSSFSGPRGVEPLPRRLCSRGKRRSESSGPAAVRTHTSSPLLFSALFLSASHAYTRPRAGSDVWTFSSTPCLCELACGVVFIHLRVYS